MLALHKAFLPSTQQALTLSRAWEHHQSLLAREGPGPAVLWSLPWGGAGNKAKVATLIGIASGAASGPTLHPEHTDGTR